MEHKFLLADTWNKQADLSGYWMSEKYDGHRVLWTGSEFRSRNGNRIDAPRWFTANLPNFPLDGELWRGYGQFEFSREFTTESRFLVFDAPAIDAPFEYRIEAIAELLQGCHYAVAVQHEPCRDNAHALAELARVESHGGEGLCFRRPGSMYAGGRDGSLVKLKSFADAEAEVVRHEAGNGAFAGTVGSLIVKDHDGIKFGLGGLPEHVRRNPPPIGSVVTYKHAGFTYRGIPRGATFMRVRHDA